MKTLEARRWVSKVNGGEPLPWLLIPALLSYPGDKDPESPPPVFRDSVQRPFCTCSLVHTTLTGMKRKILSKATVPKGLPDWESNLSSSVENSKSYPMITRNPHRTPALALAHENPASKRWIDFPDGESKSGGDSQPPKAPSPRLPAPRCPSNLPASAALWVLSSDHRVTGLCCIPV